MTEIVTRGTGRAERTADAAELEVTFLGVGPDRAAAVRALAERVRAATPALDADGVTVRHRRTDVHPAWRDGTRVGSEAREHLTVRLAPLAGLAGLLARLVAADPEHLHGPRWLLGDPDALLGEAQAAAVGDARRRAEGYAAALDARLGTLLRLSEAGDAPGPAVFAARASAESAPTDLVGAVEDLGLEPEPVQVTVSCTTTWTLA